MQNIINWLRKCVPGKRQIGELRGEAVGALRDYQADYRGRHAIDLATDKVLFALRGITLAIQAVGEVN